MTCDELAVTGAALPWALCGLAVVLLLAGLWSVRNGRSTRGWGTLLLVGLLAVFLGVPAPGAQAACPGRVPLTIVQTSVNSGLSPTQAPSMVTGRVSNNGSGGTYLTAVTVSISSVTKARGAMPGICDSSDFLILDARMTVGEQLAGGGGTADFAGARIGFLDKPLNQDSCKGAVIQLLFTSE